MNENRNGTTYQSALLSIQEAAKQSGVVVPILLTAYFAAISMSDLKKVAWGNWGWAVLFTAPAVLWLISLFLSIQIFVPARVSPEAKGPSTYERILQAKYRLLLVSQYALLAGLLIMVICVVLYFVCSPPPPPTT